MQLRLQRCIKVFCLLLTLSATAASAYDFSEYAVKTDFSDAEIFSLGSVGEIINIGDTLYDDVLSIKPYDGTKESYYQVSHEAKAVPGKDSYLISFDFLAAQTDQFYAMQIRDVSQNKLSWTDYGSRVAGFLIDEFGNLVFSDSEVIKTNASYSGYKTVSYSEDVWYSADILLDAHAGTVSYFLNNEQVFETELITEGLVAPEDVVFYTTSKSGNVNSLNYGSASYPVTDGNERLYIDNFRISYPDSVKSVKGSMDLSVGDKKNICISFDESLKATDFSKLTLNKSSDNVDMTIKSVKLTGNKMYLSLGSELVFGEEYILSLPENCLSVTGRKIENEIRINSYENAKAEQGASYAENSFATKSSYHTDTLKLSADTVMRWKVQDCGNSDYGYALLLTSTKRTDKEAGIKFTVSDTLQKPDKSFISFDVLMSSDDSFSYMAELLNSNGENIFSACFNANGKFIYKENGQKAGYNECLVSDGKDNGLVASDYNAGEWHNIGLVTEKTGSVAVYFDGEFLGKSIVSGVSGDVSSLRFYQRPEVTENGVTWGSTAGNTMYIDNIKFSYVNSESAVTKIRLLNNGSEHPLNADFNGASEMAIYFSDSILLNSVDEYTVRVFGNGKLVPISLKGYDVNKKCVYFTFDEKLSENIKYNVVIDGVKGENECLVKEYSESFGNGIISGISNYEGVLTVFEQDSKLKIKGKAKKADENVTLRVFAKGKSPGDVTDMMSPAEYSESVLYTNQVKADSCGIYEFSVNLEQDFGTYNMSLTFVDGKSESLSYDYKSAKDTEDFSAAFENLKTGKIFYTGEALNFDFSLTGIGGREYGVWYDIYERESGEIVFSGEADFKADENGNISDTLTIDFENRYGEFYAELRVFDNITKKIYTEKESFYRIMTRLDGVKNKNMGVSNHVTYLSNESMTNIFNMESKAGMGMAREEIHWRLFETSAGNYALNTSHKAWLNKSAAEDISPFIILGYDNANVTDEEPPVSDSEIEKYADYVYEVVSKTKDYANYYEVWNEYNLDSSGVTPEDYVKLLKAAYVAAKAANEDAVIYGCAAAYFSGEKYGYTMHSWIDAVIKAGGGEYMDGISIHPYTAYISPEQGGLVDIIEAVKEITKDYNLPVTASEYGWVTWADPESKKTQAKYMVRSAALSEGVLDNLIWYTGMEKEIYCDFDERYSLFNNKDSKNPYEPKPGYIAIAAYNAIIADGEVVRREVDGNGVYNFEYKNGTDNSTVNLLWTEEKAVLKEIKAPANARLYDIYGNEAEFCYENGYAKIEVSDSPVYLIQDENFKLYLEDDEENISLKVVFDDSFTLKEDLILTVAAYSGDMLLDVEYEKITANSDIKEYEVLMKNTKADTIKGFLWTAYGIKPLAENLTLERN